MLTTRSQVILLYMNNLEKLYLSKIAGELGVDFDDFGRPLKAKPSTSTLVPPTLKNTVAPKPPTTTRTPPTTTRTPVVAPRTSVVAPRTSAADFLRRQTIAAQQAKAKKVRNDPASKTTTTTGPKGVTTRTTGRIPPSL